MQKQSSDSGAPLRVEAARQAILETLAPIAGRERVALRAALDRVLAEDMVAPFDVPAHDNSAMDGYALRAADLAAGAATELVVVGTALAGSAFSGVVGTGQAVRVMTGAVLPRGADTVAVQEDVTVSGDRVSIPAGQKAGANVRRAGEDLARGRAALNAGTRVGPAELGLLASLGFAEVAVRRRLRVAFFSTGDEVASIGKTLAPGEVYDSNRYTLYGALTRLGVDLLDMGVVRDDPAEMEAAFREAAAHADVILTTGGVSVGDADYVKDMVARLGEVKFWKIDIKPGRPMAFGRIGNTWLFGLPGNPVAVMVNFYQIVVDALLKLQGVDPLPPRVSFPVVADMAIRKTPGRREFPRGFVYREGGAWHVRLAGNQGSGVLRSMSEANCFIVLPEERGSVAEGELVEVQVFEGLI
ncbi:MAG: molybdopterin molybdenumtransferase MoeA [Rhodocyclaceae bacterium]|nr:molybdopterin molybdenumtransferase MoeA [Rhodocyclaceae bacterium]